MSINAIKIFIIVQTTCLSIALFSMEGPSKPLYETIFTQLQNDTSALGQANRKVLLEDLSVELLTFYEKFNTFDALSKNYVKTFKNDIFIKHLQLAQLYNTLRKIQKNPPVGSKTKEISSKAFNQQYAPSTFGSFSYKEFCASATKTGLIKAFKDFLILKNRFWHFAFVDFTKPEHLQWVAYLHNKHGYNGAFTYDPSNAGINPWDNPILGTYTTQYGQTITITRYSFLVGLFDSFSSITQTEAETFTTINFFSENYETLINNLNTAINNAKNNNKPSSAPIRAQYNSLVTLEMQRPANNTQQDATKVFNHDYQSILTSAQQYGLQILYKTILLAQNNTYATLFDLFITPGNLEWTAYLQNKHSIDNNPFSYNETDDAGTNPWDTPVLGQYTTPSSTTIPVTRYSFLHGLFEAIDNLEQEEWNNSHEIVDAKLTMLSENLQKAQINAINKPKPEKPQPAAESTSAAVGTEQKITTLLNAKNVQPLVRNKEIELLFRDLEKIPTISEDIRKAHIGKYISLLAQNEPTESAKKIILQKNVESARQSIKNFLTDYLLNNMQQYEDIIANRDKLPKDKRDKNYTLMDTTHNNLTYELPNDWIKKLKGLLPTQETANFYCALVDLFTKTIKSYDIYTESSLKRPIESAPEPQPEVKKTTEQHCQAMIAGGIGDALGRVTEFITTTQNIFTKYPNGVRTYNDFTSADWSVVPDTIKQNNTIAPYTDDTRMAILVMQALISADTNKWDLEKTMGKIAYNFISDINYEKGWIAEYRAPGNAVQAAIRQLIQKEDKTIPGWWDAKEMKAGGCGSVMRAHPFGIVFSHDPKKAADWAAEHSKITHSHPWALAACAAMATGIAYAIQHKEWDFIFAEMIKAAQEHNADTANKMREALQKAQEAQKNYSGNIISDLKTNTSMRSIHDATFKQFPGWKADDAIAATVYAVALAQSSKQDNKIMEAIYIGVHTPGDSDSIASMAGALLGARYGDEKLPEDLVDKLEDSALLKEYDKKGIEIAEKK